MIDSAAAQQALAKLQEASQGQGQEQMQQHAQQVGGHSPVYTVLDEQGPDHAKCFQIGVDLLGYRFLPCWGGSKKEAEQEAARVALESLGVDPSV